MRSNRIGRYLQSLGDVAARRALGKELQHLDLACRQLLCEELDIGVSSSPAGWSPGTVWKDDLAFQDARDRAPELPRIALLQKVPAETDPLGFLHRVLVVQRCEGDDLGLRQLLEDLPPESEAASIRETDIHEDQLGPALTGSRESILGIRGDVDVRHPGPIEGDADRLGEEPMVVDDQDADAVLLILR